MLRSLLPAVSLALAIFPPAAMAQNSSYLLGLAQALNNQGLTALSTIAAAALNDTAGTQLLQELQTGNKTVFAPSNDARALYLSFAFPCII